MSDAVMIAFVGCIQAVTVALVGVLAVRIGRVRKDTTATRDQVVNDHHSNLRDENDSRHAETMSGIRSLHRDIGGIREEIRGLRKDDRELFRRVNKLEDKDTP